MEEKRSAAVDEYIAAFPPYVRERLNAMRKAVTAAAPDAQERMSYSMPAYFLNGPLVYFAAFKNHIGFYPTADGKEAFFEELKGYKGGKGSVQFPHGEPLPLGLVESIVKCRAAKNAEKAR